MNRHNTIVALNFPEEELSKCRFCREDEESSFHFFARCDMFSIQRQHWFERDQFDLPFPKLTVKKIVGFLREVRFERFSEDL